MKKLFALVLVALVAFTPNLLAQTSDIEAKLRAMPTKEYHRAYVGINTVQTNWNDDLMDAVADVMFPLKKGITLGYLRSYNIVEGLPLFVEYGANLQCIFGRVNASSLFGDEEDVDSDNYNKARTFAVNVPVNASLRLSFNNDELAVTPFVGLNFRYNLSGKTISVVGDEKTKTNMMDGEEGALKRFQAGLNYGVSVSYDVYTLSIGSVSDFTSFIDGDEVNGRFNVTTISLGYAF